MGAFTGANAQSTGSAIGAAAGAYWGPAGMAIGSAAGGALGGMLGGGGGAGKATREVVKGSRNVEREWLKIRELSEGSVGYLKKIAADGIDLKLPERGPIGDDQLPAVTAELDDVDRRTLDDAQKATSMGLSAAGMRGNTRAVAAGQESLGRLRQDAVRAARDRSIAERDSAFGRLSSERDKEYERAYGEQTWEHGQQLSANSQLFATNIAARQGKMDELEKRAGARAAREGAQVGARSASAGNLTGTLMGIAGSFGGGNGGFSWGSATPSGPGNAGNAGASPIAPSTGGSSFLGNIWNTAANSRKIASQPSPMVTTRPAGMTGSEWRPRA